MKVIRFFLKCFFLLVLFVFGIAFADKQHLSNNVIGIRIRAEAPEQIAQEIDLLVGSQSLDAESLCFLLNNRGITASCASSFFDSTTIEDLVIPAGVYNAVYVDMDDGAQEWVRLIATGKISKSFCTVRNISARLFQKVYIFFLSALGHVEKITLKLKDMYCKWDKIYVILIANRQGGVICSPYYCVQIG